MCIQPFLHYFACITKTCQRATLFDAHGDIFLYTIPDADTNNGSDLFVICHTLLVLVHGVITWTECVSIGKPRMKIFCLKKFPNNISEVRLHGYIMSFGMENILFGI